MKQKISKIKHLVSIIKYQKLQYEISDIECSMVETASGGEGVKHQKSNIKYRITSQVK